MAAGSEIIIAALTAAGSASSLAGIIWSWLKAKRNKPQRMSVRLPDGTELSIRTDKATPEEIENFITTIVETKGSNVNNEGEQAKPEKLT